MVLMLGAYLIGILSVVVGIFMTPIPKELGFYRFLTRQNPILIGLNPVFHHGVPWGYTWEEWYQESLAGKSALVTGANSGIGYDLVEALAKVGASVTMVCRNPQKCHDAQQELLKSNPTAKIETMTMDTSSLASVRALAEEYVRDATKPEIDLLFLNAGMAFMQGTGGNRCAPKTEKDGIDYLFQVNYLGHHLLYRLLEANKKLSQQARIVSTSSASAFQTYSYKVATSLETLHGCSEPEFDGGGSSMAYGQSKLAQILWTKALDRQSSSTRIVNAFHPGLVQTAIQEKIFEEAKVSQFQRTLFDRLMANNHAWQSPDGALTGLYLAVAEGVRGKYFHPQAQEVVHPDALDTKLQDELWAFSDQLVKGYLDPILLPNSSATEQEDTAEA